MQLNSRDLLNEAHTCECRLRGHMEVIRQLGALTGLARIGESQPACGLAKIRPIDNGLWEPFEDGELAMVIPVCSPWCFEQFGCEIETIEVIDLIAFNSRRPAQWRWRTGNAWALGEHLIADADEPVRLVATPLQWLRLGGEAACILDWRKQSPAWSLLRDAPGILCGDHTLRDRVSEMIRASIHLPRVEIDRGAA